MKNYYTSQFATYWVGASSMKPYLTDPVNWMFLVLSTHNRSV